MTVDWNLVRLLLRVKRDRLNLWSTEAAAACGIHRQSYREFENGIRATLTADSLAGALAWLGIYDIREVCDGVPVEAALSPMRQGAVLDGGCGEGRAGSVGAA